MTQVKSAQDKCSRVALRGKKDPRTLAAKRADLLAQIDAMALTDLAQVSARLKSLHKELERKEGRKWTQIDLADATGIAYRTLQSWETGQVENRDGTGYDKLARFYSKKLRRKVTREWIVFGRQGPPPAVSNPGSMPNDDLSSVVAALQQQELMLRRNQEKLDQILETMERLEAELIEEAVSQPEPGEVPAPEQDRESGGGDAP